MSSRLSQVFHFICLNYLFPCARYPFSIILAVLETLRVIFLARVDDPQFWWFFFFLTKQVKELQFLWHVTRPLPLIAGHPRQEQIASARRGSNRALTTGRISGRAFPSTELQGRANALQRTYNVSAYPPVFAQLTTQTTRLSVMRTMWINISACMTTRT